MKKLLSVFLMLATLASLIVLPVSAEENTPEQVAMMERAVVETALAYFWKGAAVEYDYAAMTIRDRKNLGESKLHTGDAPEKASLDNIRCYHCADWVRSVYLNALGYAVCPSRHAGVMQMNIYKSANDPDIVLKLGGDGIQDKAEFEKKLLEVLRPGDIYSASNNTDYNNSHTMMYLGDYKGDGKQYIIHCSGAATEMALGDQKMGDSIKMSTVDYFVTGSWGVRQDDIQMATVMRPTNILKFSDLTAAAKERLNWPLLELGRESSSFGYTGVTAGEEITVTSIVGNHSAEEYKNLTLTDPAPIGGEVVPGSVSDGGTIKDGGVTWTVNVPPDTKLQLTYKVKVTAPVGGELLLPAGSIGDLPSRDLRRQVSGKPIAQSLVDTVVEAKALEGVEKKEVIADLEFANVFYRNAFGLELNFPATMQELVDGLFEPVMATGCAKTGGWILQPKAAESMTEEFKTINNMILLDHRMGQLVWLGSSPDTCYPKDRVPFYLKENYVPGDIIATLGGDAADAFDADGKFIAKSEDVEIWIYLGDGKVAAMGNNGFAIKTFSKTVERCHIKNVLVALQPTLTNENLMSLSTKAPAEPEIPETPAEPEVPETPAEPEAPETPETPEAPAEQGGFPVAAVVGIGAAVVVAAAVILVVLKKK